jgi:hypothetical protein
MEEAAVSAKSIKDWLAEGELLYNQALAEYQSLRAQLEQLERTLAVKNTELNQMASVIGRPPAESGRRLSAELVEAETIPSVAGSVTRALTGRGLGRA